MLRRQVLTRIVLSSITIHSYQSKYKQLFLPISPAPGRLLGVVRQLRCGAAARSPPRGARQELSETFSQSLLFHSPETSWRRRRCSHRVSCVCSIKFYNCSSNFHFLLDSSNPLTVALMFSAYYMWGNGFDLLASWKVTRNQNLSNPKFQQGTNVHQHTQTHIFNTSWLAWESEWRSITQAQVRS